MSSHPEVEFVHPVSAGGSVKFVASGVNFSIFTNFLCFFLLKLLKLGEIDGVKFLAWKSGGVKFWTNSMSDQISKYLVVTYNYDYRDSAMTALLSGKLLYTSQEQKLYVQT